MNYYNEHDPKAAAWLRELIKQKLIPAGDVDERDIENVKAHEIKKYTQHHFFAGIGGWPLALQIAGWPETKRVGTGSCPCQPFSVAGKKLAEKDSRHVWPWFRELVRELEIPIVFGEQVAGKAGRKWLAGVRAEMVFLGYIFGAADLCAASVGAPHIRQRLFWVADCAGERWNGSAKVQGQNGRGFVESGGAVGGLSESNGWLAGNGELQSFGKHRQLPEDSRVDRGLADSKRNGGRADEPGRKAEGRIVDGRVGGMEHTEIDGREQRRTASGERSLVGGCGTGGLGDANQQGFQRSKFEILSREGRRQKGGAISQPSGPYVRLEYSSLSSPKRFGPQQFELHALSTTWDNFSIVRCADGKTRRFEPKSFPLAHGISGRVGLLRGYGNAIVPQVAAQFILASIEAAASREKIIFQPELGME